MLIHRLSDAKTSCRCCPLGLSSVWPSTRPQPWPSTGRRCYWLPSVASLPMLWHEISLTFQHSSSASRPSPVCLSTPHNVQHKHAHSQKLPSFKCAQHIQVRPTSFRQCVFLFLFQPLKALPWSFALIVSPFAPLSNHGAHSSASCAPWTWPYTSFSFIFQLFQLHGSRM